MIERCSNKSDENVILRYIEDDIFKCLYLYADLKRYGLDSKETSVYIQRDDAGITAVLLIYHSCLHIYSRDGRFDAEELAEFFAGKPISMFYCEEQTCLRIWNALPNQRDHALTLGSVGEISYLGEYNVCTCEKLKKDEFREVADLLFRDESIGASYSYEDLLEQLKKRADEGFSRNLAIKQGGRIIAHACTNAEIDDIAIVGELIVLDEYRRRGYATDIWKTICGILLEEGKRIFSFYFSQESQAFHHKIGFKDICRWGKIVRSIHRD